MFLYIPRTHEQGQICICGFMSKICLLKIFLAFWNPTSAAKTTDNNHFRVPIHFTTNRFTLEKFPPPPPLLHPTIQCPVRKKIHGGSKRESMVGVKWRNVWNGTSGWWREVTWNQKFNNFSALAKCLSDCNLKRANDNFESGRSQFQIYVFKFKCLTSSSSNEWGSFPLSFLIWGGYDS